MPFMDGHWVKNRQEVWQHVAMLFMAPKLNGDSWLKPIHRLDPTLDLRVWPAAGDTREVVFILTWKHPLGELKKFPNLKCIASLGFGVDHILRDPDLPQGVPVTRLVDPGMIAAMSEYVIAAVLHHTRQFNLYRQDQARRKWKERIPLHPQDAHVGIMGLGYLGMDAARKLSCLGFPVSGWSRSAKAVGEIRSFSGDDALEEFLSRANILVCLLPLTPATRGILNRRTFAQLPAGAYVINAARGEHLIEEDLLGALDSGHLSGACLDVFQVEPLPESHPFWGHPRVTMTPHIASLTHPQAVAPQIVENYRRVRSGQPPLHVVDVQRGY
jgi:glyoxylate/hydroxypyruvate reductase